MMNLPRVRSKSTVLLFVLTVSAHAQIETPVEPVAPAADAPAAVTEAAPQPATVPAAQTPASQPVTRRATALVFQGADGLSYYRAGLRAEGDQKIPATLWIKQRAVDALTRAFPGGGGVLARRDRRAPSGEIVQRLLWIKPAPGGGVVEEELPFDTAAFAREKNLDGFSLRAISNLQLPQTSNSEALRVFLRVTFEKIGTPQTAETPTPQTEPATPETREFLGWYDLNAKTFATIFNEPRLVGAEASPEGRFVHVLAARANGQTAAILLDETGKELRAPSLSALRNVGFLYRGWIDDTRLLLKKSGQNQLVIYDAATDSVSAPKGLEAFAATLAPRGDWAVTWPSSVAVDDDAPSLASIEKGAPQDIKLDGPLIVADWSADGERAILLGAPDERRRWTRAWLLSPVPLETREIVLPTPVSSAKFLYEALT
ncbi:MAG TPA: hypothetical protein VF681_01935 [Abditibacteriaceae bacterium]|jgi:hypothetical protein